MYIFTKSDIIKNRDVFDDDNCDVKIHTIAQAYCKKYNVMYVHVNNSLSDHILLPCDALLCLIL